MKFNIDRCRKGVLKDKKSKEEIVLRRLEIRKFSMPNLDEILNNKELENKQELVIDNIMCTKEDFRKLTDDKRYEATVDCILNNGNNVLQSMTFTLGSVGIIYDMRNVEYEGDYVIIKVAQFIIYPYATNSYKISQD